MSADPNIGHGAVLQRSDDGTSSGAFATIGKIHDLGVPGLSRETVDVTTYGSTERWREYVGGLRDAGEMSVEIMFDPGDADITAWITEINTDTAGYYKIVFPDDGSTEWGFAAFVTGLEPQAPIDGRMAATVSFKLTGKPGFVS